MAAPDSSHAPVWSDVRGAASFALALVSAGLAGSAIYLWNRLHLYTNDLPPLFPGGQTYTVRFYPWAASIGSVLMAFFALRLLRRSLLACRAARLPRLTFLHVGTGVLLLPLLLHLLYTGGKALLQ